MKKRQKRIAAVILALSMLAAPYGIPAGVLAESQKNQAGIRGYIAESEGYPFAEFPAESSVEETGTADGQDLTEMGLQTGSIGVQVKTAEVNYQKADWNGSTVIYSGQTAAGCIQVESSIEAVTWSAGWYAVSGTVTISEPITVSGEVHLILTDGCNLTASKGIVVTNGNSLNIYAQSGSNGTLTATGTTKENNASAGIGGGTDSADSGSITIHGGVINATGGCVGNGQRVAAGIGGGTGDTGGSGSNITIYGGKVTAVSPENNGGNGGAGIGGGGGDNNGGSGNTIAIRGGTVQATGGDMGAGIGGGNGGKRSGNGTNITISGGTVTAIGGSYAAGIGGGGGYQSIYIGKTGGTGSVTITGGVVNASSPTDVDYADYKGAPIGNGGNQSTAATVNKATGIVFENGVGTVCGNVTFDGNYEVPADYTLNIPAGAGLSGSGILIGGGTFTTENLMEDMISVPEDWSYTGEDLTEAIRNVVRLNGKVTICGQTFVADTDGWTLDVGKVSDLEYTVKYTHDGKTLTKTVTIAPKSIEEAEVSITGPFTYNRQPQTPVPVVTLDGKTLVKDTGYTVTYANNTNAGSAVITVTGKGNYTGAVEKTFTIGSATPRLAWESTTQELTYTGKEAMITAPKATGPDGIQLVITDDTGPCQFSYAAQGGSEFQNGLPINVGTYTIRASVAAKGNYAAAESTNTLTLTINRAQGQLTVPETSFSKKFGDTEFSLNCSTNGDGRISYASSDEGVVTVSADGTARITGAGTASVTVSLAESANFTGDAEGKEVTVTVDKADAPDIGQETRNYTYASGSKGMVTIDVAGKLPKDRGKTDYTVTKTDEKNILSDDVSVDGDGKLTFTVLGGQSKGDTASIRVTAAMANYKDAEYTVEIKLVEKIAVEFTLAAQTQDDIYDGKPHNGYAGLAAQTVNGSYTGIMQFWYTGTGGTSYGSAAPPVRAGSYTVTASVPEDDAEYAGLSEAVPFIIRKAAITIKADNKTAQAGSPLPELTYTVSGLAEKEQLKAAPELFCSVDMNTAGIYPITAGGAKVPDADNYQEEITYESGTLTVLDSVVHVTGISLDKTTLSLSIGSIGRLTAVFSPENATDKSVSWAFDNPSAVSVDSSGNINAVSVGTAVITVTAADGGYTASCTVTVRNDTAPGSSGSGGSGGSGSSGSVGSGNTGSGTGQAAKQPFIRDSSGRKGWDVIRAEAETAAAAPAGGTVTVDMNGAVSVPGSVFAAVRGKNVTLSFDMGNGIIWSVNGRDVAAETAGSTDFSVKTEAGTVPKGLIEETAGGLAHMELSLAHEGAFGFTATLTLRIISRDGNGITAGSSGTAAEYSGMYANLFYYNPDLRSLEFICAGRIGEDGTADLPFVHASDYTVILSAAPMGGTGTPESPQEPGKTEKPQKPVKQAVKSVKLSKTLYTYNGKPKKPSVIATDTAGRKISAAYYTVSYQNNKKTGKAAATVTFKGGYSGTVKKTFTIRPAGTSIRKITAVSGGFTVKWKKKTAQTSGYQIQYSADAGFQGGSTRSIFVKNNSKVQKTVKNLKGGKQYYVRIRTYKTVKADGKNTRVYSAWSRVHKVKTLPAASKKEALSAGSAAVVLVPEKEDGKKRAS